MGESESIYLSICEQLKKKSKNGEISSKEINFCLGCLLHIDKKYRSNVIKDMRRLGFIKLKNGRGIYFIMNDKINK